MFAANHREAPITALDPKADITDVFAFRSYDGGATPRVTLILCVDPFLDPANGPNWFPLDPEILYEIKVDNNHDAVEDIVFQFRFATEQRLPNLFQVYAGVTRRCRRSIEFAATCPSRHVNRASENHVFHFTGIGPGPELYGYDDQGSYLYTHNFDGTAFCRARQCRSTDHGLRGIV